jgi:ribosomal protein S18 acetylase RimI-like enzyme
MRIHETELTHKVLSALIKMSEDWAAENSCYGYRANEKSDIEGNRIFLAEEGGRAVGYLFGKVYRSESMQAVMPEGTAYFEVEELYVVPEKRCRGIGQALFRFAENAVGSEAGYMVLSTATKNWKAVFRFYLDELDMRFWSARLFKPIGSGRARDI